MTHIKKTESDFVQLLLQSFEENEYEELFDLLPDGYLTLVFVIAAKQCRRESENKYRDFVDYLQRCYRRSRSSEVLDEDLSEFSKVDNEDLYSLFDIESVESQRNATSRVIRYACDLVEKIFHISYVEEPNEYLLLQVENACHTLNKMPGTIYFCGIAVIGGRLKRDSGMPEIYEDFLEFGSVAFHRSKEELDSEIDEALEIAAESDRQYLEGLVG